MTGDVWRVASEVLGGRSEGIPAFSHVVVPSGGGRSFLVPLGSREVSAAACSTFNLLRPPKARALRSVAGLGFSAGVAPHLLRRRVSTLISPDEPAGEQHLALHLADALDEPGLQFALGLGSLDAWWKPVLQLFSERGAPLGFAKVAWNPLTDSMVSAERRALELVRAAEPSRFSAPAVLLSGEWRGHPYVVTAPLPSKARRTEGAAVDALAELSEIDGARESAGVVGSRWWVRVAQAFESSEAKVAGRAGELLELAAERLEDTEVLLGRWHGDWVAWNMATAGGTRFVWDWEYCAAGVPVGLDLVHHHYQHLRLVGGLEPAAAAGVAGDAAEADLRTLQPGVPITALSLAHSLELIARALRAVELGAPEPVDLEGLVGFGLAVASGRAA